MHRLVPPRVVTSMAALAVVTAGLLPAVHVHSQDDDTVIHRHVIDDDSADHVDEVGHHETRVDHDGHVTAPILPLTYDAAVPFVLHWSAAVTILAAERADFARARHANRATLLPTHDPPLRFVCSPAPPASA